MPATLVIGHKNPDTDAICSAIAYADLLRQLGQEAEAVRCGAVNARTLYILERAQVDPPRLVMDVRPTVANIYRDTPIVARLGEPFHDVYERMVENEVRSMPVQADDGTVAGMLTLLDLLGTLLPGQAHNRQSTRRIDTSLERLVACLDGDFEHAVDPTQNETLVLMVGAMRAANFTERLHQFPPEELIIVCGNRDTIHRPAIEYGVRAVIVTGGQHLDKELIALARDRDVSILQSPHDTAMTTLLAKTATIIDGAVDRDFISFSPSQRLADIRTIVMDYKESLFPVIDDDTGKLIGLFTRTDMVKPAANRIVLVDHNELAQAVRGAEESEIVEVIDHHRLGGGLRSAEPIRFINEPVGSTCTIVACQFRHHRITPSHHVAMCMAGGIVSDTLLLTSPTTTDVDRKTLNWLSAFMTCSAKELADGFFATGSALTTLEPYEAVTLDCKEFSEQDWRIAIAQIEELGLDKLASRKAVLTEALEELVETRKLDFACVMVTDIARHNSVLLTAGHEGIINAIDYPELEPGMFELTDIVSRKKQLLPHLTLILNRTPKLP
ncbi:MAG: manganese-dependent inorganic pyrophosphatase [Rhodothermales bacterium]|jgi:manganese-dependent inorganic pyrophosphatase